MTQYLSPLVSCLVCREVKSAKGLFTHFIVSHTEEGKQNHAIRVRKSKEEKISNLRKYWDDKKLEESNEYYMSPKFCCCGEMISYEKKNNTFCSHRCSALVSNSNRPRSSRESQKLTFARTISERPKYTKIRFNECKRCEKSYVYSIENKTVSPSFCSSKCATENKIISSRESAIKRNFGGVRSSKRVLYRGVSLGSTFELQLAMLLDELCIRWVQPKKIKYIRPDGIQSTYTADFYLPDYDIFLDPKNDFLIHNINPGNKIKDIDKIAFVVEQNQITVCVIDQKNITEGFVHKLVGQEGFEPSLILSCKDSGFDHSHHCPVIYL